MNTLMAEHGVIIGETKGRIWKKATRFLLICSIAKLWVPEVACFHSASLGRYYDFDNSHYASRNDLLPRREQCVALASVVNENMIGDFNYWAIPYNAPNKAAALVYANLVLEPELQAAQVQPANGFCCGWGISTAKVTDAAGKAAINDAQNNLGDAAEDQNILAKALVSDIAAEYQDLIEADWEANVLLK